MVDEITARQRQTVFESDSWTISLDGWKDCSRIHYYSVMLVCKKSQIFLTNLRLDMKRPTSPNLMAELIRVVEPYITQIKAVVTDSPNAMTKLRKDICAIYAAIVNIRCPLHAINLMCHDIVKCPDIKPIVANMSRMVIYFRNSEFCKSFLKD